MNFINLPKDIKNIIGSFLFDYDRHQIKKTKVLLHIHTIKDKYMWYDLYYLYHKSYGLYSISLNPFVVLSNELNEIYIKNYQDKIDYYKNQKDERIKKLVQERRQQTKDNKIAKKLRRNTKYFRNKIKY